MTISSTNSTQQPWWKEAVVYQVYPASFKDSNGDGLGDLPGITTKLDYIRKLGVDVIWICPMYKSPQVDLGYDISDYEQIHEPYGSMQDMQDLIDGCHQRGMKIIVDLVINHTSDRHAWFKDSRSSTKSERRDWYIWRPAKYNEQGVREPPNNWRSNFGGSVWTWDEQTQEYYLHLFAPEQPDLNWDNEKTRKAIYASAMESWLKRGVDGFRIDTVNMYSKPPGLEDAEPLSKSQYQGAGHLYCNGPRMHEFLDEMSQVMAPYDTMTVGELPCTPDPQKVLKYVSAAARQLDMVFQFDVVDVGSGTDQRYDTPPKNWRLPDLKKAIQNTQVLIKDTDAWITSFMENHDQARSISRFASDAPEYRVRCGKLLALLNSTLSGTQFIYQGQEIGMVNVPLSWPIDDYKDVSSVNYYDEMVGAAGGDAKVVADVMASLQYLARDHSRVPMSWDSSAQGGFSTNPNTWMRTHDLAGEINVADQENDSDSVLSFWKKAVQLRKEHASVLVYGNFDVCDMQDEHVFAYTKRQGDQLALVVLNFTNDSQDWGNRVQKLGYVEGLKLVASTYEYAQEGQQPGLLQPYEGRLYMQEQSALESGRDL